MHKDGELLHFTDDEQGTGMPETAPTNLLSTLHAAAAAKLQNCRAELMELQSSDDDDVTQDRRAWIPRLALQEQVLVRLEEDFIREGSSQLVEQLEQRLR